MMAVILNETFETTPGSDLSWTIASGAAYNAPDLDYATTLGGWGKECCRFYPSNGKSTVMNVAFSAPPDFYARSEFVLHSFVTGGNSHFVPLLAVYDSAAGFPSAKVSVEEVSGTLTLLFSLVKQDESVLYADESIQTVSLDTQYCVEMLLTDDSGWELRVNGATKLSGGDSLWTTQAFNNIYLDGYNSNLDAGTFDVWLDAIQIRTDSWPGATFAGMTKTAFFGFPTPTYDYGDGSEVTAVAEFTSLMSAAASTVLVQADALLGAINVEVSNRISADNALSNNISVVSAQLASLSSVFQAGINTVSNALSNAASNRASADTPLAAAINVVSAQLVSVSAVLKSGIDSLTSNMDGVISSRGVAVDDISNQVSAMSNLVSAMSQAVSVAGLNFPAKCANVATQSTTVSISTPVAVSGLSLAVASGSSYYFRFMVPFRVKTLAGGVSLGVSGPAMTAFVARVKLPTGGSAAATTYTFGTIPAIGGVVSNVSAALSGVTLMAELEGYANPSDAGSLQCTISITVTGSQVGLIVLTGAVGQAWKLS